MQTLRAQIDRLDCVMVRLLSRRQRYIERAAEIKSHRAEVRDEARINDVLAKVMAEAIKRDLNPVIAAAVWRELIERSIALELVEFDRKSQRSK